MKQGGSAAPGGGERLQKALAAAGIGSRRQIEAWIRAGRLQVDGRPAQLGVRVQPHSEIRLDGALLPGWPAAAGPMQQDTDACEVLLYHKPAGEVTTRSDPQGRPTVFDRLPPPHRGRWVVVGRLDVNTTGVLLFTNDGALAHRLMHPSSQVQRDYLVRVRGRPSAQVLQRLRRGVQLPDGPARFETLEEAVPPGLPGREAAPGSHSWFRVTLHEGRNREVRRLWQAVGFEVSRLTRIQYGPVQLPPALRPGQWERLGPGLVQALQAQG